MYEQQAFYNGGRDFNGDLWDKFKVTFWIQCYRKTKPNGKNFNFSIGSSLLLLRRLMALTGLQQVVPPANIM